jgi:hypothetical protein
MVQRAQRLPYRGDNHGGFRVRITEAAGKQTVVPNFSTWQEASEWTEEQLRLEQEATALTASRATISPARCQSVDLDQLGNGEHRAGQLGRWTGCSVGPGQ